MSIEFKSRRGILAHLDILREGKELGQRRKGSIYRNQISP